MNNNHWILTQDGFLGGAVKLYQPAESYRAGSDTVMLAAAVNALDGERILDAGAGVGGVAICLAHRVQGVRIDGLEYQSQMADIARSNVKANGMADRVAIVDGDLAHPPKTLRRGSYDHVVSNPPYLEQGKATPPPVASKATANVGLNLTLTDWIGACIRFARPRGRVTFIHRADRLHDLLAALSGRAGDINVYPVWPKPGAPARRVIVSARRGANGALTLSPGLVVHEADGAFTNKAEAVMRYGESLDLFRNATFGTKTAEGKNADYTENTGKAAD